jgi:amidase
MAIQVGEREPLPLAYRAADTEGLAALLGQQGVEVLLAPSNGPAELIDHVWGDRRGGGWSQIAGAAAIAGYPSLTVPAGLVSGLPVGIALVGNRNQDGLLAVDVDITQLVDGNVGVHAMLPKKIFTTPAAH